MPASRPADDQLDAQLRASAPPSPQATNTTDAELVALIADTRGAARPATTRRTRRHVAAVSAAVLLGLAGAGTAAATVTEADWLPWAQDPDVAFTYTLPSGAVCDERIGAVTSGDSEIAEATREFFRNNDILALADVDAMIAQMRTEDSGFFGADGVELPADHPDWQPMTPDMEYSLALGRAVSELVEDELESQGFDVEATDLNYGGQASCPGADW